MYLLHNSGQSHTKLQSCLSTGRENDNHCNNNIILAVMESLESFLGRIEFSYTEIQYKNHFETLQENI